MSYGEGTARVCDWPGCGASYDAWLVLSGQAEAPGWKHHPGFGLHMCGEHAPRVWGPGGLLHISSGSTRGACSCGARLTGWKTLGDLGQIYLRHIVWDAQQRESA